MPHATEPNLGGEQEVVSNMGPRVKRPQEHCGHGVRPRALTPEPYGPLLFLISDCVWSKQANSAENPLGSGPKKADCPVKQREEAMQQGQRDRGASHLGPTSSSLSSLCSVPLSKVQHEKCVKCYGLCGQRAEARLSWRDCVQDGPDLQVHSHTSGQRLNVSC